MAGRQSRPPKHTVSDLAVRQRGNRDAFQRGRRLGGVYDAGMCDVLNVGGPSAMDALWRPHSWEGAHGWPGLTPGHDVLLEWDPVP